MCNYTAHPESGGAWDQSGGFDVAQLTAFLLNLYHALALGQDSSIFLVSLTGSFSYF